MNSLLQTVVLAFFLVVISTAGLAQLDTIEIITYPKGLVVVNNLEVGELEVRNANDEIVFAGFKFIHDVQGSFQVLSLSNEIEYYSADFDKLEEMNMRFGFCGTVPHYTLEIEKEGRSFIVYSDETFYDTGNKIPREKTQQISQREYDDVFFLNGTKRFTYTSNYGLGGSPTTAPTTLIVKKRNRYQVYGDTQCVDDYAVKSGQLFLMKNNVRGIYSLTEIKYIALEPFVYGLARFELPDGRTGFVDINGIEYLD